jgi:hypothetical protein
VRRLAFNNMVSEFASQLASYSRIETHQGDIGFAAGGVIAAAGAVAAGAAAGAGGVPVVMRHHQ